MTDQTSIIILSLVTLFVGFCIGFCAGLLLTENKRGDRRHDEHEDFPGC